MILTGLKPRFGLKYDHELEREQERIETNEIDKSNELDIQRFERSMLDSTHETVQELGGDQTIPEPKRVREFVDREKELEKINELRQRVRALAGKARRVERKKDELELHVQALVEKAEHFEDIQRTGYVEGVDNQKFEKGVDQDMHNEYSGIRDDAKPRKQNVFSTIISSLRGDD